MADLDLLSIGLINDMYAESRNDDCKYAQITTQEDFDRFYEYFFEKGIKYSQLYSQCVMMTMLGIKVGKRMMIYEYGKISFRFMCV